MKAKPSCGAYVKANNFIIVSQNIYPIAYCYHCPKCDKVMRHEIILVLLSETEFVWRFYALSASKAIFRARRHRVRNETRRKPTTRKRCPTLFDKWHRIFYAQSHRHSWTYQGLWLPSHGQPGGGGSQNAPARGRSIWTANLSVHSWTCQPPDHDYCPKS